MPTKSIRVYREFADALERLREDGLNTSIQALRESANQLEAELQQERAESK